MSVPFAVVEEGRHRPGAGSISVMMDRMLALHGCCVFSVDLREPIQGLSLKSEVAFRRARIRPEPGKFRLGFWDGLSTSFVRAAEHPAKTTVFGD